MSCMDIDELKIIIFMWFMYLWQGGLFFIDLKVEIYFYCVVFGGIGGVKIIFNYVLVSWIGFKKFYIYGFKCYVFEYKLISVFWM